MGISNLGLKICPEVEFWPFLRMRSRKLAKTTWVTRRHRRRESRRRRRRGMRNGEGVSPSPAD